MDENKVRDALARLGGVGLIAGNAWLLSYDIACHKHNPDCNYRFEAFGPEASSSSAAWVPQGVTWATATDTGS